MATVISQDELPRLINRYLQALRRSMQIDAVYLFGSYSRGTAGPDSDIDLLIVSPDFTENLVDNQVLLLRARRDIDYRIEPHPVLRGELQSNVLFTIANKEMQHPSRMFAYIGD